MTDDLGAAAAYTARVRRQDLLIHDPRGDVLLTYPHAAGLTWDYNCAGHHAVAWTIMCHRSASMAVADHLGPLLLRDLLAPQPRGALELPVLALDLWVAVRARAPLPNYRRPLLARLQEERSWLLRAQADATEERDLQAARVADLERGAAYVAACVAQWTPGRATW